MDHENTFTESRREPRKLLRKRAEVHADANPPMQATTTDISVNGMGLVLPAPLQSGANCLVSFEALNGNSSVTVMVKGIVSRCTLSGMEGYRTGIQITQIHPNSIAAMRALLQ